MTCSLFHCFDPYVYMGFFLPLKWGLVVLLLNMFNWQIFLCLSGVEIYKKKVLSLIWLSFFSLIKNLKNSFLILSCLFILVFFTNFLGLVPFMFTFSSHLSTNLSFSLSLWLGGTMIGVFSSINGFLSHMVPTGTPTVLWIFLVMVESVSQVIRPLTLSIRLMANVMAGHLIMNLFGTFISSLSCYYSFFLFFQGSFLLFEMCVSLVQAYVFVSLLSLYWDET